VDVCRPNFISISKVWHQRSDWISVLIWFWMWMQEHFSTFFSIVRWSILWQFKVFFIQWLINWFLPNLVRWLKPARRHVQYILPLSHIVSSPNIWIYYQIWIGILDYFCVFFVLGTRCWKRWRLTGWCPKCGHSLTVVVVLLRLNVDILFRVHVTCDMWRARVKVKTLSARHVHQVLKQIFGINVINHNSAKCELNFFVY